MYCNVLVLVLCSSLYHRTLLLMEHLSLFFTKNVNNINQRITYVSLQALSVVVRRQCSGRTAIKKTLHTDTIHTEEANIT